MQNNPRKILQLTIRALKSIQNDNNKAESSKIVIVTGFMLTKNRPASNYNPLSPQEWVVHLS